MAQSFTYNDINNLYNKNLGRSASQDEYQGWSSGQYGADPYSQIPQSGEAQTYAASQPQQSQTKPVGTSTPGPQMSPWAPAPSAASAAPASAMPAGMNPQLAAIYQKAGITPGARGTGFADWEYWNDKPSQYNRLTADLAGTGTDQPTGTPGQGAWSTSGQGQPGAPGMTSPGMGGTGSASSGTWTGTPSGQSSDLFNLLMKRANQSLTIDPNDPVMKQQSDAYNAQNTRAERDYLSGVAEKGGANANISAETRAASEKVGQLGGQFEGQLMQNELNARRQEIQSALSGAAGFLTQEQQMQLQEEMANLDRAQQQSQFSANLGQQSYQFDINDQFRNSPLGS